MWLSLLLLIFAGVTALQLLIWLLFPLRFTLAPSPPDSIVAYPPVTVVICARNEARALSQHLPKILNQIYPAELEVLVIDDDSSDDSPQILSELAAKYPALKVLSIRPKTHPGKKMALSEGIRAAKYPWIVLTDADCAPASSTWLKGMLAQSDEPGITLGYAPMLPARGLLHLWSRFETAYTALQYFSTAHAGWPFMGVGRNMVVHRAMFDAAGGFAKHLHITGGDDDLLVNSVATKHNTRYCLHPNAFVYSASKTSWGSWVAQKRRHITAGLGYKTWHNMVLGGVAFTHAVHYGLAVILLILIPAWAGYVLVGYALRLALVWFVYARALARLHERDLLPWVPILDGFMAVWLGGIAPFLLLFGKKEDW